MKKDEKLTAAKLAEAIKFHKAVTAAEPALAKRRKLPMTRQSITHKFDIAGHEGYVHVGVYEDGTPGEMFITMSKEGSTIGGLMDSFATSISLCFQHGVALDKLVEKFSFQQFDPQGMTGNRAIPFAKSIVDYIFRWMAIEFKEKEDIPYGGDPVVEPTRAPIIITTDPPIIQPYKVGDFPTGPPYTTQPGMPEVFVTWQDNTAGPPVDQAGTPPCPICGSMTVRNGACHKCQNCGESLGCS